jgi:hypothetical protein
MNGCFDLCSLGPKLHCGAFNWRPALTALQQLAGHGGVQCNRLVSCQVGGRSCNQGTDVIGAQL